jgi:glycosyltransferase involved in cell wall biosynthesis
MLVYLIKELRERHGCRVILGTVGSSQIAVDGQVSWFEEGQLRHIESLYVDSIRHTHMQHVLGEIEKTRDIDIVHDFLEVGGPHMLAQVGDDGPPALHTLQWDLSKNHDFYRDFDGRDRVYFNGVSDPQMDTACENLRLQSLGVVYNGVDVDDFIFQAHKEDFVLTLARFADEKGQDIAARVCTDLGIPLRMAGPVGGIDSPDRLYQELANEESPLRTVKDVQYFKRSVLPIVRSNSDISWIGNIGGDEKRALLASAQALLMPIQWEEPFGMSVIEALASGTPVVAMRRGAMPILIEDGYNGFLVDDEQHLKERLQQIGEIQPENCRRSVETWFSATDMAREYFRLYQEVLDRAQEHKQRRVSAAYGPRWTYE